MYEKKIAFAYYRELGAALLVYIVMLTASVKYGRLMDEGLLRTFVLGSPMLGFCLMIWVIVRQFKRVDEFVRKETLETLALAAAITAGLSFTYGFLETAGYPRLSMFTIWPVMGGAWGLLTCVRRWMNR
ncbi:MAG: hypothetical protein V4508_04910 [Pseudomonadota bacterium]